MEKRISASARNKKTIDRPFDMQFVHYKELTTLLRGDFGGVRPGSAWERGLGKRNASVAPGETPVERSFKGPVNKC
jgi:hypothetical protein